jgi:hypothetical protein
MRLEFAEQFDFEIAQKNFELIHIYLANVVDIVWYNLPMYDFLK